MLKFLKMTVAEDAIITEETQEVLVEEEVMPQEEKETSHQDVKDLEVIEAQLQEKEVLAEEVSQEVQHPELASRIEMQDLPMLLDVMGVLRKDPQGVQKVLVMRQEKEDQEEVNFYFLPLIINPKFHFNKMKFGILQLE